MCVMHMVQSMTPDEIKAAREARGWSQERMAAELGVHRSMISRIESGRQQASGPVLRLIGLLPPAGAQEDAA